MFGWKIHKTCMIIFLTFSISELSLCNVSKSQHYLQIKSHDDVIFNDDVIFEIRVRSLFDCIVTCLTKNGDPFYCSVVTFTLNKQCRGHSSRLTLTGDHEDSIGTRTFFVQRAGERIFSCLLV